MNVIALRSNNCTFPPKLKALSSKCSYILEVHITHLTIYECTTPSHAPISDPYQ